MSGWKINRRQFTRAISLAGAGTVFKQFGFAAQEGNPLPASIEMSLIDEHATPYATFQSHNQKVVSNRRGIFATYLKSRNQAYTAQEWRLVTSSDDGKTFAALFSEVAASSAPALETDLEDNLYLARPDFVDGHAYLYRFRAANDYREPLITRIPGGSAGKYALANDLHRGQLYYFAHNNTFHVIGFDGIVRSSRTLLQPGKNAALQYPHLCLAADHTLYAAWTTQAHGRYLYWDIHVMRSPDGGDTWETLDGTKLPIPVIGDDSGPTDRITLDDEFEVHTWLSNFLAHGDKLHLLYLAQFDSPRMHYVRYDLRRGRKDVDIQPEFKGETLSLRGLDGFFAARAAESSLYCVVQDAGDNRLACLHSADNGGTWQDHAVGAVVASPYAIGGCRELTADGSIVGTFTDQSSASNAPRGQSKVYFFTIGSLEPPS